MKFIDSPVLKAIFDESTLRSLELPQSQVIEEALNTDLTASLFNPNIWADFFTILYSQIKGDKKQVHAVTSATYKQLVFAAEHIKNSHLFALVVERFCSATETRKELIDADLFEKIGELKTASSRQDFSEYQGAATNVEAFNETLEKFRSTYMKNTGNFLSSKSRGERIMAEFSILLTRLRVGLPDDKGKRHLIADITSLFSEPGSQFSSQVETALCSSTEGTDQQKVVFERAGLSQAGNEGKAAYTNFGLEDDDDDDEFLPPYSLEAVTKLINEATLGIRFLAFLQRQHARITNSSNFNELFVHPSGLEAICTEPEVGLQFSVYKPKKETVKILVSECLETGPDGVRRYSVENFIRLYEERKEPSSLKPSTRRTVHSGRARGDDLSAALGGEAFLEGPDSFSRFLQEAVDQVKQSSLITAGQGLFSQPAAAQTQLPVDTTPEMTM